MGLETEKEYKVLWTRGAQRIRNHGIRYSAVASQRVGDKSWVTTLQPSKSSDAGNARASQREMKRIHLCHPPLRASIHLSFRSLSLSRAPTVALSSASSHRPTLLCTSSTTIPQFASTMPLPARPRVFYPPHATGQGRQLYIISVPPIYPHSQSFREDRQESLVQTNFFLATFTRLSFSQQSLCDSADCSSRPHVLIYGNIL